MTQQFSKTLESAVNKLIPRYTPFKNGEFKQVTKCDLCDGILFFQADQGHIFLKNGSFEVENTKLNLFTCLLACLRSKTLISHIDSQNLKHKNLTDKFDKREY